MSSIRGNIRNKDYTKKGFTLIEIMISVSLIGIITCTQITIISRYMKNYRIEVNRSRDSFYIDEAFMIIEHQIKSAKYIDVVNNKIVLVRHDGAGKDYIRTDKDSDIIISYGSEYSSNTNNILKSVQEFKVEKFGQVIYIFVKTNKGNTYGRCLALERTKIKEGSS